VNNDEYLSENDPIWRLLEKERQSRVDIERGRRVLMAKMARSDSRYLPRTSATGRWTRPIQMFRSIVWSPVAGIALGGLALVMGWHLARPANAEILATSVYTTDNGQQARLSLADGSTVVLSPASRLEVPVTYGQGNRTLRLTGEAMFSVVNKSEVPFIVVAGPSATRVLGTSFSVRHYPTDTVATIAVQDGKVSVGSVVVSAAQQVSVSELGVSEIQSISPDQFTFASGVLMLQGMPLSEAISDLNRWYDVDIKLADAALGSLRIKGKLAAGSVADLAEILELMFPVRLVREGRTLTVFSK
jgi:ferric-dicitrate binding protein FerR (iron transport regulator)